MAKYLASVGAYPPLVLSGRTQTEARNPDTPLCHGLAGTPVDNREIVETLCQLPGRPIGAKREVVAASDARRCLYDYVLHCVQEAEALQGDAPIESSSYVFQLFADAQDLAKMRSAYVEAHLGFSKLGEEGGKHAAEAYYGLSCLRVSVGDVVGGLRYLQKATRFGEYRNRARLDEDFDRVRRSTAFQAVLEWPRDDSDDAGDSENDYGDVVVSTG